MQKTMREINVKLVTETIKNLCIKANYHLPKDVEDAIKQNQKSEISDNAKQILGKIIDNIEISKHDIFPLCQDTGMVCVFLQIGQDTHFTGGSLEDAINEGVRQAYDEGYLRKSVVKDPLNRINTGDNTPAVINYEITTGDICKIEVAPKGFGSENMSGLVMLRPADGIEGVKKFVVDTVKKAGPNPCPPIVVGVGIGGTFDKVASLAKKALLRPLDKQNSNGFYASLEDELCILINETGIGPQGFGGKTTSLKVNIETYPTHIAGLPVAVNINCHVTRHASCQI